MRNKNSALYVLLINRVGVVDLTVQCGHTQSMWLCSAGGMDTHRVCGRVVLYGLEDARVGLRTELCVCTLTSWPLGTVLYSALISMVSITVCNDSICVCCGRTTHIRLRASVGVVVNRARRW